MISIFGEQLAEVKCSPWLSMESMSPSLSMIDSLKGSETSTRTGFEALSRRRRYLTKSPVLLMKNASMYGGLFSCFRRDSWKDSVGVWRVRHVLAFCAAITEMPVNAEA